MCSLSGRAWDRRSSRRRGAGDAAGGAEGRRSRSAGSRSDGGGAGPDAVSRSTPARVFYTGAHRGRK
jgi:hypothetical protein